MRLEVARIAEYVQAQVVLMPDPKAVACGLSWDSRQLAQDFVYVALPGERVDGHAFVRSAIESGAIAVLTCHALPAEEVAFAQEQGVAILQTADTYQAVTNLARGWRTHLKGTVIALTGSVGKTTTKNLVRDVLATTYSTSATKGNQNNELGVPKTLIDADAETQCVVVEMGMRGLGQLESLCEFVHPTYGLITNCGECHIELLGSRENIARAKSEVITALPDGTGVAILNAADDMVDVVLAMAKPRQRGVRVIGFDGSGHPTEWATCYATDITVDEAGCPRFALHLPDETEHACQLALRGVHNVHNAVAAAALAFELGVPADNIVMGLAYSQPEEGRGQVATSSAGITVVNDAYNANPTSMKASLAMFAAMRVSGRRVACLGDMGELGETAPDLHASVGTYLATLPIDELVCVGPLSRNIADAAVVAGYNSAHVTCFNQREMALSYLSSTLASGDAVLCKASHSMALDQIAKGLIS